MHSAMPRCHQESSMLLRQTKARLACMRLAMCMSKRYAGAVSYISKELLTGVVNW